MVSDSLGLCLGLMREYGQRFKACNGVTEEHVSDSCGRMTAIHGVYVLDSWEICVGFIDRYVSDSWGRVLGFMEGYGVRFMRAYDCDLWGVCLGFMGDVSNLSIGMSRILGEGFSDSWRGTVLDSLSSMS
ncbi:hypothetical protein QJS04_geneDACA010287 [Acorus gramineus]|uniref:Uncharacterized protein n=1 Tax=Acorus gramineus TaxID=55184 RepID=A0AAV9A548_ACOGR|nr:hypothetical protein QJS04_geneDACA010287 [Acorus gramineus]